jgi:hypothetical protein
MSDNTIRLIEWCTGLHLDASHEAQVGPLHFKFDVVPGKGLQGIHITTKTAPLLALVEAGMFKPESMLRVLHIDCDCAGCRTDADGVTHERKS